MMNKINKTNSLNEFHKSSSKKTVLLSYSKFNNSTPINQIKYQKKQINPQEKLQKSQFKPIKYINNKKPYTSYIPMTFSDINKKKNYRYINSYSSNITVNNNFSPPPCFCKHLNKICTRNESHSKISIDLSNTKELYYLLNNNNILSQNLHKKARINKSSYLGYNTRFSNNTNFTNNTGLTNSNGANALNSSVNNTGISNTSCSNNNNISQLVKSDKYISVTEDKIITSNNKNEIINMIISYNNQKYNISLEKNSNGLFLAEKINNLLKLKLNEIKLDRLAIALTRQINNIINCIINGKKNMEFAAVVDINKIINQNKTSDNKFKIQVQYLKENFYYFIKNEENDIEYAVDNLIKNINKNGKYEENILKKELVNIIKNKLDDKLNPTLQYSNTEKILDCSNQKKMLLIK